MAESIETIPALELAPEPPPKRTRIWLRDNLFSNPASAVMSIISIVLVIAAYSGLLSFIFSPSRRWDAVTFNVRLLMVQAYPTEQFVRVWLSVGIVVTLLVATLAFWRIGGRVSPRSLGSILMGLGGGAALGGALGYAPFAISSEWPFLFNPGGGPFSASTALIWIGAGALLLVGGYLLRTAPGERAKQESVPLLGVVGILVVLGVIAVWLAQLPVPFKDESNAQSIIYEPIANSTRWPWTILAAWGIGVYFVVWFLRDRVNVAVAKRAIVLLWIASFPVIVLVILRDPDVDYGRLFSWFLPVAVGFAVVGGALLYWLAGKTIGELGRVIGAALVIAAAALFLVDMEFLVRFLMIALALFALAAPTFGGEGAARWRFVGIWAGFVLVLTYLMMIVTSASTVEVPGTFFVGGLALTLILAITSIVLSFPLGILLALGRASTMPIFRLMSTVYIEIVRGVPLITWLLVMFLMFPVALPPGVEVGGVVRAIMAMTFFSAAYLAENVRGGLQSIPKGQYEASKAMGMTTAQMTVFITLPQALRAVIPALVGQVIALFKDTSLVTIVGLFDFLHIARQVIPAQSQPFSFLGTLKETVLFVAVIYWLFTFTFSRISLRLEKKLGVGER
jgi:general L-amino acid transport system permease protein